MTRMILKPETNAEQRKARSFVYTKRHNLKNSARSRSLRFDLSSKEIQRLLSNPVCYFCNTFCSLETTGGISQPDSFTFERVNPVLGYVSGNVVCACNACNNRKSVQDQVIVGTRIQKSSWRVTYEKHNHC